MSPTGNPWMDFFLLVVLMPILGMWGIGALYEAWERRR